MCMKHKYFSLLLALLMNMAANRASAHDFEVDDIYYNITSSEGATVVVTYQVNPVGRIPTNMQIMLSSSETITYDGKTYSVTSIGDYAFSGCRK